MRWLLIFDIIKINETQGPNFLVVSRISSEFFFGNSDLSGLKQKEFKPDFLMHYLIVFFIETLIIWILFWNKAIKHL